MKILQRYISKELLLPFFLSFTILNFIFMAGYMVKAAHFIVGKGVPVIDTLQLLMLALPGMVGYTVPTSILMAVLVVFGNLSQHNELRAMKASGVNLLQAVFPAFIFGLVLSLGMFVFNDQVASNAGFEMRKVMKKMILNFPKALIETGRFVKLNENIIFMAKRMQDDRLEDIVAYEMEGSDDPVRTIIAESGEIVTDKLTEKVRIRLYNGSISDTQNEGIHTIQFKSYEFPSLGQEDISKMRKKKKDYTIAEIILAIGDGTESKEDVLELWTAFHERISFAFGSFIFVLIGIPIAVLVRRGEIVLSFGIAMAMASSYYVFFAGAKTLSIEGVIPPFIVLWLPNILLAAFGAHLLRRSLVS